MNYLALIPLFVLMLLPIHAQDETAAYGWPITARCLPTATTPPDDWTFPGTLLMTGHYGLHAYSAAFETPYVVAFFNPYSVQERAGLSPDKRWYAIATGQSAISIASVFSKSIQKITVYSTGLDGKHYSIPWETSFAAIGTGSFQDMYWLDNHSILYASEDLPEAYQPSADDPYSWNYRINLFTGEVGPHYQQPQPYLLDFIPSPDWSRAVRDNAGFNRFEPVVSDDDMSTADIKVLIVYVSSQLVAWKPDSLQFAAFYATDAIDDARTNPDAIALFDRDGQLVDIVHTVKDEDLHQFPIVWSDDGRYFAFYVNSLRIADIQEKTITDTCLTFGGNYWHMGGTGVAWSPDGTKLAYIEDRRTLNPVRVIDLERWQQYTVAHHEGAVVGWADDAPDEPTAQR